jgi:nitrogen-specific signal transduction histidine kinase
MNNATTAQVTELARVRQQAHLLEEQLQHLQKIETLGHLVGGVAHDFANLLTVILGSAELLIDCLPAADRGRDHARDILDAANRARGLTAQLLAFSRSERPQPAVIDLNEVVQGMQGILGRTIREDIDLQFCLTTGVDSVCLDKTQLEQVLVNLVVNARDAMPGCGRVTVETRFVTLTAPVEQRGASLTAGRYAVLAVSDTGSGMSAETRQRLFEPLFTTKAKGNGTGFGLFTCDTIIREAGGLIFADSELGSGSVFTVLLPAVAESKGLLPAVAPASERRGHESVLLVEDSAGVRTVVRRALEGLGYRVFESATAREALALVDAHGPGLDLVFSDVILSDTTGAEIVRGVQARVPGIKALFMSGHTTQYLLREHRLPSGACFIQKPFGRLALGQKLREVLDA